MKPQDVAAYVFLAVAWGFSFLVVLKVVQAFGWVGAVAFRALVAAAMLIAVARMMRRRLDFGTRPHRFAVVGATTVAGQLIGISYATPRIGTALAAIFVAAIPLFSMVVGRIWGIERLTTEGSVGLVLGFAGIVALVGFPDAPATGTFILGCVASLLGSLAAAFGSNYASHRLRGAGAMEVSIGAFVSGGLMTLPMLLAVPVPSAPQPRDYVNLALLGAVMSATTYVLYFRLVARIGATRAISVEFAVTLVAVLVGAALLGERLSAVQLVGGLAIMLGCSLVLGLVRRMPGHRSE
ncbi:MAG: DMT family transporter [Alphaproteobacteria bacterium]|nr:DMT family transporter [Alphaproteobacteria bacterium]